MFNVVKKEIEWGGRTLTLETGRVARQADGAVVVSYGETVVLCTAVAKKEVREGTDFFPLTVHYQEKAYAAGKIPGGFFKREGRPAESETLTSRLIDRPIRPLFPEGFFNEVQIICTVISHDLKNDADIPALIGASAALAISGVPFQGPIAGARVGYVDGEYVLNPSPEQKEATELDLIVSGTESSVLMVESEAKILSEKVMLGSVEFGHQQMQPVIKLIEELAKDAGKDAWTLDIPDHSDIKKRVNALGEQGFRDAYAEQDKQARVEKLLNIRDHIVSNIEEEDGENFDSLAVSGAIKKLEKDIVRTDILKNKNRIDGRKLNDVRDIVSDVQVLPKAHGSALFTRGETQALAVATLGTAQDMQIIDALAGEYKERFLLHYNFPPYSVGEASPLRGTGRREIGHGKLAWRAIHATLPSDEEFSYTLRVVSEVTESNGSSSMATVCGTSLALMDAGVPVKAPVAGIAMGLVKEGDDFAVLSDILGDEDHLGDMDFKVAGTSEGITALQMDIKINGITTEIMQIALDQAKEGRLHILDKMGEALTEARDGVSVNAPQITTLKIDKEKIGALIGPGGKMIREICEETGVKIDIEDDGTVNIAATDGESSAKAIQMVKDVTDEAEVGKVYEGKVTRLLDFGALVMFMGKTEGLVHISELKDERVESVSDVVKEGDEVKVLVVGLDRGKIRLSMKRVNQDTGENISDQFDDEPRGPRGPKGGDKRGGRGGDRKGGPRGDKKGGPRNDKRGNEAAASNDSNDDEAPKKRRFF